MGEHIQQLMKPLVDIAAQSLRCQSRYQHEAPDLSNEGINPDFHLMATADVKNMHRIY